MNPITMSNKLTNIEDDKDYSEQFLKIHLPKPIGMKMERSLESRKKLIQCLDSKQGFEHVCAKQYKRIQKIRAKKR